MSVEFNSKSLRNNDFSYKDLEITTPLLPLSKDVVQKTISIFNMDVQGNKEKMELEMLVEQPHLHEFFSNLMEKPHGDTKAYREGAIKMYTIFTNQAYEKNTAIPKIPTISKTLYERDFDIKPNNENFTSLFNRVIRNKIYDILAIEPGLNQPLTSRDNFGPYRMSFGKGMIDSYYALSKNINGRAIDKKFEISQ